MTRVDYICLFFYMFYLLTIVTLVFYISYLLTPVHYIYLCCLHVLPIDSCWLHLPFFTCSTCWLYWTLFSTYHTCWRLWFLHGLPVDDILKLITFEIFAAERLRLMGFDNRLIIDCFANVVNILIWLFSTNDRLRSAKYESNYLENPFPEIKGVNLLSKTHCNDKSKLKPKTVLQE